MIPFTVPTSVQYSTDIILRSADGVEFRAHRVVLSVASSVFEGMFLVPQPPAATPASAATDEVPCVDLSESSDVISILLSCMYPVPNLRAESWNILCEALMAARKYEMEGIFSILRNDLLLPSFLSVRPLAVYSTACILGLKEEAQAAATETLKHPLSVLTTQKQNMGELMGIDFARLVGFHLHRSHAIISALDQATLDTKCVRCRTVTMEWRDMAKTKIRDRPFIDDIFSVLFIQDAMTKNSASCSCGSHMYSLFFIGQAQRGVDNVPMSRLGE